MPLTLLCSFFENTKQDLLLFIQRKISSQKFPNDKGNKILFLFMSPRWWGTQRWFAWIYSHNQPIRARHERPAPLKVRKDFYTFPTSAKNSVVAISLSDSFAKFCNSPNMGLLYCKYRSQNLRRYGPFWLTDYILYLQVYFYHVSFRLQEVFMVRKLMWFNWQQIILDRWLWTVIVYGL